MKNYTEKITPFTLFTDGSKTKDLTGCKVFSPKSGPLEFKDNLGKETRVFQAELAVICQACELLSTVENRSIVINRDSRSDLKANTTGMNSKAVLWTVKVLARLSVNNCVYMKWINERHEEGPVG